MMKYIKKLLGLTPPPPPPYAPIKLTSMLFVAIATNIIIPVQYTELIGTH